MRNESDSGRDGSPHRPFRGSAVATGKSSCFGNGGAEEEENDDDDDEDAAVLPSDERLLLQLVAWLDTSRDGRYGWVFRVLIAAAVLVVVAVVVANVGDASSSGMTYKSLMALSSDRVVVETVEEEEVEPFVVWSLSDDKALLEENGTEENGTEENDDNDAGTTAAAVAAGGSRHEEEVYDGADRGNQGFLLLLVLSLDGGDGRATSSSST